MPTTERDFVARLREWRYQKRLTQERLAELLGYDVSYIRKIEGGTRPPSRQFLGRLALAGGPSDDPMGRGSSRRSMGDVARSPLPQPPDQLVGRDDAIDDIAASLVHPAVRCVTLAGPPGIGKTRLAMAVAARLDDALPDGAWWVPLLDVTRATEVAGHVLRALGVADRISGDPVDAAIGALRDRRGLLVLDNFEHVMAARSMVSRLIAGTSNLKVLVTTRESLELISEKVVTVERLGFPDPADKPSLEAVRSSFAVSLFLARATMARPSFELNEANCQSVLAACALLDGLPLAIVVTAGAIKTMDATALVSLLRVGDDLGDTSPVDLPPHHRTLEVAVERSWELLTGEDQDFLVTLAVFSGGFTVDAAAYVAGVSSDRARRLLGRLCRKSLVEAHPDAASSPRFDLLQTIRQFLRARLVVAGRGPAVQQRHLTFFVDFARRCARGLTNGEQVRCAHAFADDFDNLNMAFDAALRNEPDSAAVLAGSLWRFFLIRDIPTGQRWLEEALMAAIDPTPARAVALAGAGALGWVTGRPDVARQCLAESAVLAEDLGLTDVSALVLVNQGALAEQQDRLEDADAHFAEALDMYQRLGDRRGQAVALNGLGMVRRRHGDLAQAWPLWQEAAAKFRASGDGANEALAMGNLAWAAESEGRLDEAEQISQRCRSIQIALGDGRGLAATSVALGRIAFLHQRFEDARRLHLEALDGFERLGDIPWVASTLLALSAVCERTGNADQAVTLLSMAERTREQIGARPREEERSLWCNVVDRCRLELDGPSFDRAWSLGRVATIAEAAALASGRDIGADAGRGASNGGIPA